MPGRRMRDRLRNAHLAPAARTRPSRWAFRNTSRRQSRWASRGQSCDHGSTGSLAEGHRRALLLVVDAPPRCRAGPARSTWRTRSVDVVELPPDEHHRAGALRWTGPGARARSARCRARAARAPGRTGRRPRLPVVGGDDDGSRGRRSAPPPPRPAPRSAGHPTWSATRVLTSGSGVPPSAVTGTTGRAMTAETTALSATSPTTTTSRQAWRADPPGQRQAAHGVQHRRS